MPVRSGSQVATSNPPHQPVFGRARRSILPRTRSSALPHQPRLAGVAGSLLMSQERAVHQLLSNAFDRVAAYLCGLLGFGARRGGCGTIEPLLRLFQAIERHNCNSTRRRSLAGRDLPAKNDVLPSERLKCRRHGFNDVEKCCLIRYLQCLGNPKGWRYFGLSMERAQTDPAENEAARQCCCQLDLRSHIQTSLSP